MTGGRVRRNEGGNLAPRIPSIAEIHLDIEHRRTPDAHMCVVPARENFPGSPWIVVVTVVSQRSGQMSMPPQYATASPERCTMATFDGASRRRIAAVDDALPPTALNQSRACVFSGSAP